MARVYMLACDHRWQWEEWCDAAAIDRSRISEVKRLAYDAFRLARDEPEVRRFGALLLDRVYAADLIDAARRDGLPVGTAAERAGRFPLEWDRDPFHEGLEGVAFVKVLIRYRPEWRKSIKEEQIAKLLELQSWCRDNRVPLVVEIVIVRAAEDEREFENQGRPMLLAAVIHDAYTRGLVPDFWKIEATTSREGAAMIDEAIRRRPEPRQLILGKGADAALIARWFAAAAALPSMAGFAIGRSVFWDPSVRYLTGRVGASEATAEIAERYLALVKDWQSKRAAVDQ